MNFKQALYKYHPFLFFILFLLTIYFFWSLNQSETKLVDQKIIITPTPVVNQPTPSFPLAGNSCNRDECLFGSISNELMGVSTVSGYFTTVTRSAWGDEKKCNAFTITGGSEQTTQFFVDLVDRGNSVNSLNVNRQPIINVNIDNLNQSDKQRLLISSEKNPAKLVLLFPESVGRAVPVCFSFVEILKVED